MSTNLECLFVERKNTEWYYILENYDAPKNAWSWLDYSTAFGPFNSFERAYSNLSNNHANPGGYSTITNEIYEKLSLDKKQPYEDLFKYATKI